MLLVTATLLLPSRLQVQSLHVLAYISMRISLCVEREIMSESSVSHSFAGAHDGRSIQDTDNVVDPLRSLASEGDHLGQWERET